MYIWKQNRESTERCSKCISPETSRQDLEKNGQGRRRRGGGGGGGTCLPTFKSGPRTDIINVRSKSRKELPRINRT